jgi:uncharacterized protein YbjT (DUF2867 family)
MSDKKIIAVVGATGSQGGGLVRAIVNDPSGGFSARAITRAVGSEGAQALARRGAEVVAADVDDEESLRRAFEGAYGAYCVTFFSAHFSPEKELAEATAIGGATDDLRRHLVNAGDTRQFAPERQYTHPHGQCKCPTPG